MTTTLLAALIALFGLGLYVSLHLFISRTFTPKKIWRVMRNLFFVLIVILWFVTGWTYNYFNGEGFGSPNEWIDLGAIVALMLMIHVGYLTFYAFIDRSISVRTFVEIETRGNKFIPYSELERIYNPQAAFARRLEILTQSGFIILNSDDKTYTLSPKGIRTSTIIRMFKNLYKTGPGG